MWVKKRSAECSRKQERTLEVCQTGAKHSTGFQRNQKKVALLQTNNGAQWRKCVMWHLDRQALQQREEVMERERKEEKKGWRRWERIKACVTASPGPERGLMHPDVSSLIHQHTVVTYNIFLWHSASDDVSLTGHSYGTDRENRQNVLQPHDSTGRPHSLATSAKELKTTAPIRLKNFSPAALKHSTRRATELNLIGRKWI